MRQYRLRRVVLVSLLGGMFVLGFLSGSVSQRSAQAQVPGGAKGVLEQATGAGGALGSVAELGSSIMAGLSGMGKAQFYFLLLRG